MLTVRRDGTKLVLEIEHGLLNQGDRLLLTWEAHHDVLAAALTNAVADYLGKRVEAIRQSEYESGWRDAKGRKRPKRSWFWRSLILRDLPK